MEFEIVDTKERDSFEPISASDAVEDMAEPEELPQRNHARKPSGEAFTPAQMEADTQFGGRSSIKEAIYSSISEAAQNWKVTRLTRRYSFLRLTDKQLLARLSRASDLPEVASVTEDALDAAVDRNYVITKCVSKWETLLKLGAFVTITRPDIELLWRSVQCLECPAWAIRTLAMALKPCTDKELLVETCDVIYDVMERNWSDNELTLIEISRLIYQLAAISEELRLAMFRAGICNKLMEKEYWNGIYLESPKLAENIAMTISCLSLSPECAKTFADLKIADHMNQAMAVYGQNARVIVKLCQLTTVLASYCDLRGTLGEGGICVAITGILRKRPHAAPPVVVRCAAETIAQMAMDNMENECRFGAGGACEQLVEVLVGYGKLALLDEDVIGAVVQTLLAIHSICDDIINASRLRSAQTCAAILALMERHPLHTELNLAACMCLLKLAQQHIIQSYLTDAQLISALTSLQEQRLSAEVTAAARNVLVALRGG